MLEVDDDDDDDGILCSSSFFLPVFGRLGGATGICLDFFLPGLNLFLRLSREWISISSTLGTPC